MAPTGNHISGAVISGAAARALSQCPSCATASPTRFLAKDWNRSVSLEWFPYAECPACGTVFLERIPSDLMSYYTTGYHTIPPTARDLAAMSNRERFKIELVRQFVRKGRLLEIGPSFGAFAQLAKDDGFQVDTVEPDLACREYLETVVGVRAFESVDAVSAIPTESSYDVIALWQVFEHLPDAWMFLRRAATLLRPGGILVIATPNPRALQFRLWGRRWTHVDAPRHVMLVPSETVIDRANELGLEKVLMTLTDRGSLGWNAFGWAVSLANLSAKPVPKRLLEVAGKLIAVGMYPIERFGNHGSCYTLVLRRRGS